MVEIWNLSECLLSLDEHIAEIQKDHELYKDDPDYEPDMPPSPLVVGKAKELLSKIHSEFSELLPKPSCYFGINGEFRGYWSKPFRFQNCDFHIYEYVSSGNEYVSYTGTFELGFLRHRATSKEGILSLAREWGRYLNGEYDYPWADEAIRFITQGHIGTDKPPVKPEVVEWAERFLKRLEPIKERPVIHIGYANNIWLRWAIPQPADSPYGVTGFGYGECDVNSACNETYLEGNKHTIQARYSPIYDIRGSVDLEHVKVSEDEFVEYLLANGSQR